MDSSAFDSKVYTKEDLCLIEEVPQSCAIVIFGASGDLTHRKLLPSLLFLQKNKKMPKDYYILGVARTAMSDEKFRQGVEAALDGKAGSDETREFLSRCFYYAGQYDDESLYGRLAKKLEQLDKKFSVVRRHLFYLSTPPALYPLVVKNLGRAGLVRAAERTNKIEWSRVVIEKPFGDSLSSARELNKLIRTVLKERQIYRIDHYLGKETVQNILMFRFANILFDPVWNRNFVDNIQISASEQLGVEHRGGYYERAGVIRDMFQNHLLQLLAMITMEQPTSLAADAVRDKKVDIFRSIRTLKPQEIDKVSVVGQYEAGVIDGRRVPAYLEEKNIAKNSATPTFAAIRFEIDNWRWQGVPLYIRSGKRLAERKVEIAVQFKHVPASIFKPLTPDQLTPNVLKFRIQPDEGIIIQFEAKHPGPKLCIGTVTMDFCYQEAFSTPPPESYVRLFHDVMIGDQTLFSRSDGVEECWRIVDPVIEFWESGQAPKPLGYPAGTRGPKEADMLLNQSGRTWF